MLTMKVELWPFGDKTAGKRLVTINLANVGMTEGGGGYDYVWTIDEPTPLFGEPIRAEGTIYGYDRQASCVEIIAAIMDNWRNPSDQEMSQVDKDTAQRLREKTLPQYENRWPY